jgi:small subunit ribosomal protein S9
MAEENRPDDVTQPPSSAGTGDPETTRSTDDATAESGTPPTPPEGTGEPAAQAGPAADEPAAGEAVPAAEGAPADEEAPAEPPSTPAAEPAAEVDEDVEDEEEPAPREKPAIPGMDLEVDIVREGEAPLRGEGSGYDEDAEDEAAAETGDDDVAAQPIAVEIDLGAGARYRATGKRKTSVARVILRPGTGAYTINGRTLEQHFPRFTLQRNIRQPLETVGYHERMDVVAKLHGGGVSAQAGALRHGISRALIDADPNLRSELKRRGFLTRDARVKERKKAGLKKARKRPQFSKR